MVDPVLDDGALRIVMVGIRVGIGIPGVEREPRVQIGAVLDEVVLMILDGSGVKHEMLEISFSSSMVDTAPWIVMVMGKMGQDMIGKVFTIIVIDVAMMDIDVTAALGEGVRSTIMEPIEMVVQGVVGVIEVEDPPPGTDSHEDLAREAVHQVIILPFSVSLVTWIFRT